MENTTSSKEAQHNAKLEIITALITAASTIAVAFIGIVPQLRQADARKIEGMQVEIESLKESFGAMSTSSMEGKSGTSAGHNKEIQAPHIQVRWTQLDPKIQQDQYIGRAKEALGRSGFTGIERNEDVVFGFDREYTGLVKSLPSGLVMLIVSGPEWQIADKKAENLRRGL